MLSLVHQIMRLLNFLDRGRSLHQLICMWLSISSNGKRSVWEKLENFIGCRMKLGSNRKAVGMGLDIREGPGSVSCHLYWVSYTCHLITNQSSFLKIHLILNCLRSLTFILFVAGTNGISFVVIQYAPCFRFLAQQVL